MDHSQHHSMMDHQHHAQMSTKHNMNDMYMSNSTTMAMYVSIYEKKIDILLKETVRNLPLLSISSFFQQVAPYYSINGNSKVLAA